MSPRVIPTSMCELMAPRSATSGDCGQDLDFSVDRGGRSANRQSNCAGVTARKAAQQASISESE